MRGVAAVWPATNSKADAWPLNEPHPHRFHPACALLLLQLGYGTSDSVSNAAPRLVEAMRGKAVVAAAAAKRHTLVLTASGEVYTWGHRGVSPRRVQLAGARDALSAEGAPITFHRGHADVARPVAAAICAGAAHSSALTSAGVVLTWRSADPALQVQEVGGTLAGKRVVSVAAGEEGGVASIHRLASLRLTRRAC